MTTGAGAGAAAALQAVLSRVLKARSAAGAAAALGALAALWRAPGAHSALDLHAALLRAAHSLLPSLTPKHVFHALPLIRSIGKLLNGFT